jgi:hypothetical protein
MRHVHKAKARERALSPDESRAFLKAALESNIRRQFKIGLHLILLTMVRKSELLLARWEHVDFEQAEWHIPAEHSKTGKPQIVFLSRQAVALFRELHALAGGSELVMPGRGSLTKPFAHNAINNALKTALQGQDIPAFTIHDLRRTASTLLHENGWPSDVVQKALNHTIGGVRGVHNHAEYAPQRREMLQFWADTIEPLMTTGQLVMGASSKWPDHHRSQQRPGAGSGAIACTQFTRRRSSRPLPIAPTIVLPARARSSPVPARWRTASPTTDSVNARLMRPPTARAAAPRTGCRRTGSSPSRRRAPRRP